MFFFNRLTRPFSSVWLQLLWLLLSSSIQTASCCSAYGKPHAPHYLCNRSFIHLALISKMSFSFQSGGTTKKKKNCTMDANGLISVKHINAVCCSTLFRLSVLTHFSPHFGVSLSRNQTNDKHVVP